MPADTLHRDVDAVDIGQGIARRIADGACPRGRCGIVERQRIVGLGEAGIEPVLDHRERAQADFFGRLEHHDQRALPLVLVIDQQLRRTDEARHMRIVPAGMHDPGGDPAGGGGGYGRCVRQAGLLDHR